ncbi:hypothetical protein [Flavobacterium undicola]|uniref:hypothetical protein n=1 Tax=Flavobacterium undicola TaxID=1932779 RepID=UPI001376ACD1|nr:hypothetical protein [Flavobacterium undicola]MBA0885422.1 hypothetical protein [Flavobacterium undicola]
MKFSEFKDKNGEKLGKIMELFQLMENENLIKIETNKCILTEFGKDIVENGGWFEHLKKKKEKEKIKTGETKKHKLTKKPKKKSFSFLTNHFKNILKIKNKT